MDESYQITDITDVLMNDSSSLENVSLDILDFVLREHTQSFGVERGPLSTVILMTMLYGALLITGVTGNVCTCIVISRNRYMHTATNYYLFSLAISDLLLLVMGVPQEMYQLWVPSPYVFGEVFCILRGFTAETSTNASILTITAFTVERYVAICHPLKSHTMSKLSRAVKMMFCIWILAAICSVPLCLQFGVIYQRMPSGDIIPDSAFCAVKHMQSHAFAVSTVLFFGTPMIVISVLYIKIGVKLRRATGLRECDENSDPPRKRKANSNRKSIIKMLVAVVVSFFLCWSPFHAQRLMAMYMSSPTPAATMVYVILNNISGVTYYLSATMNPVLYQVMSLKFQQAFKDTFGPLSKCLKGEDITGQEEEERTMTEHLRTMSMRADKFIINHKVTAVL